MIDNHFDLGVQNIFPNLKHELGKLHEVEFGVFGIPNFSQSVGVFLAFYLQTLLSNLSKQSASSLLSKF
jgi:hypothetical protein